MREVEKAQKRTLNSFRRIKQYPRWRTLAVVYSHELPEAKRRIPAGVRYKIQKEKSIYGKTIYRILLEE